VIAKNTINIFKVQFPSFLSDIHPVVSVYKSLCYQGASLFHSNFRSN